MIGSRRWWVVMVAACLCPVIGHAAAASAAHETAARGLASHLRLQERFLELTEGYLEFMRSRAPNQALVNHVGEQLKQTDVSGPMATFIATRISEEELAALNSYLATDLGRKEYDLTVALVKKRRSSPPGTVDHASRIAAFKQSLSPAESRAFAAFHASAAGKKYAAELSAIDRHLSELFKRRQEEVLQEVPVKAEPKNSASRAP